MTDVLCGKNINSHLGYVHFRLNIKSKRV